MADNLFQSISGTCWHFIIFHFNCNQSNQRYPKLPPMMVLQTVDECGIFSVRCSQTETELILWSLSMSILSHKQLGPSLRAHCAFYWLAWGLSWLFGGPFKSLQLSETLHNPLKECGKRRKIHLHFLPFFMVVRDLNTLELSPVQALWPHGLQHSALPSSVISQSLLRFMSIESVIPYKHIILFCSLLQKGINLFNLFTASGSSPMSQLFTLGGQSIGASASVTMNIPSNDYWGLVSLGLTGLVSLQSKGLSRVFFSTTIWKYPSS